MTTNSHDILSGTPPEPSFHALCDLVRLLARETAKADFATSCKSQKEGGGS